MASHVSTPALLQPLTVRGLTLRNRLVVAPMCQYSVTDGLVGDYHLVHLGRFALGGFGLVIVEATGVTADGRISHGDVGLWSDEHIPGLARIADFLHARGRGGRHPARRTPAHKASSRRPWDGGGPVTVENARPGEAPWPTVSASEVPVGPDWPTPHALTVEELAEIREAFVAAARRAPDRRLRRRRAARRARLPAAPVPLAADQPAHRRVRRLARGPDAVPARGRRGGARRLARRQAAVRAGVGRRRLRARASRSRTPSPSRAS